MPTIEIVNYPAILSNGLIESFKTGFSSMEKTFGLSDGFMLDSYIFRSVEREPKNERWIEMSDTKYEYLTTLSILEQTSEDLNMRLVLKVSGDARRIVIVPPFYRELLQAKQPAPSP